MLPYNRLPDSTLQIEGREISCFVSGAQNLDLETVASFGEEWSKFSIFTDAEVSKIGAEYFDIVTDEVLNKSSLALDAGCGTGRWSLYAAKRAGFVEAMDPSRAVLAAAKLTAGTPNIRITQASIDTIPFSDESFDFVFSLGVLHHIPDTFAALRGLVKKVKPGGHVLLYLYYNLDNKGKFFKFLFRLTNSIRANVSKMPGGLKRMVCDVLAVFLYLPLVLLASAVKFLLPGRSTYHKLPLSYYVGKSWNVIRNDALDRFGTPLEQRFSRKQIQEMMENSGLGDVHFSEHAPYWHAIGRKQP